MSDFKIIPGHEGHSVPGPVTGVEEGDGVLAVDGDGLLRPGGHQLQVVHLVAVRLVVDVKVGPVIVAEPHLPLLRHDGDGGGGGGLGVDTGGSRVHVAVDKDGVFVVISIRIYPIVSTGF